jgi:hypothetical protein
MVPVSHAAPPPAMVPAHEVGAVLHSIHSRMAAIEHNQRQAPPPQPHPTQHHRHHDEDDRHYADEPRRHDRDDRRERSQERRNRRVDEHTTAAYPRPRSPSCRHFPVGFVQAQIPAGQTYEIEVKPQVKFQGHRLAVQSSQARYFNIIDIKVGKDSQLAATGEMPAEAFSSLAVGTQMELDEAPPGIVITLIVRNLDPANAQDFGAVLYGTVQED